MHSVASPGWAMNNLGWMLHEVDENTFWPPPSWHTMPHNLNKSMSFPARRNAPGSLEHSKFFHCEIAGS